MPLAPQRGGLSFSLWHALWEQRLQRCVSQFSRALYTPLATQETLLRSLLKRNASCQYGREHGFAAIQSIHDFRSKVPVVDYDTLAPWIEQVADGQQDVLTREPVLGLRRSAGLGNGAKSLPVTESFLREVALGMDSWLADWLPRLLRGTGTSLYWALPPAGREPERSAGGLPYVTNTLEHTLSRAGRLALGGHLAVPTHVADIANEPRWRRTTLVNLLAAGDLRVMITGNPALLLGLFAEMQDNLADLLERLPTERADAIRAALDREGRLRAHCLWPHLHTLVSWTDGASAALCDNLMECFPGVQVQTAPIATQEALLTVPRQGSLGGTLAVTSHFYEFMDLDARGPTLLAHQLRVGGVYQPIVTTGGGLYRYQLGEAVRCTGLAERTPLLTYIDKTTPQSDRVGETLMPSTVQTALDVAQARLSFHYRFALCAPREATGNGAAGYTLYVETAAGKTCLEAVQELVEEQLCRSHAYWYARQLGQLRPLRVSRVRHGWQRYVQALGDNGVRRWEAKATALDRRTFWAHVMGD